MALRKILYCIYLLTTPFILVAQSGNFSVNIDKGNTYARAYQVTIDIQAEGVTQMQVSNHKNMMGSHVVPFQKSFNWEMERRDGEQMVYVRLLDKNGNELATVSDKIIVDVTPPTKCSILFGVPGKVTNKKNDPVNLTIYAEDAKFMMISNSNSFYNQKWRAFQTNIEAWELEGNDDGPRTIYAKFRDVAGNVSEVVSDRITIDTRPPFGCGITLDKGNTYSIRQDRRIDIDLSAREADSVRVSQQKDFANVPWQPYASSLVVNLEGDDGPRVFFAQFKDRAGNLSETVQATIISDITPPRDCEVSINGGSAATSNINKEVDLSFLAPDADQMMISNHPSFKGARWQTYEKFIKGWKLDGEQDGKRTVYVKFKDKAGNVSALFHADIELKRGF
jgi:hypothetical protein